MNEHPARSSSSPLIDPLVCSLVLIAPSPQDYSSVSRRVRESARRNLLAIGTAAAIVKVPLFLQLPAAQSRKQSLVNQLRRFSPREFIAGGRSFPWQNATFTQALAAEDRSVLLLAGFWLEHQIVATALHALADSYDVYVLLDAAPARVQSAARLSQDRLIQAGATPVATSQVIHEWSLEARDTAKCAALTALLLPSSAGDADR